jgi:glycerol-3-phosphate acyltransferase PlsY
MSVSVNESVIVGLVLLAITAYLIGAFPTAYLIGKINHINIFASGSGNMGANNAYHTLGLAWGFVVWAIDVGKGIVATALAHRVAPAGWPTVAGTISGIMVVIGHNWSIWVLLITGQLRGGKGAATAGGTWLVMAPLPVFGATLGLWGALAGLTGYVPLATFISFAVGSIWMLWLAISGQVAPVELVYVFAVTAMIYWRHRENWRALLKGSERQLKNATVKHLIAAAGVIVLVLALVNKL